LANIAKQKDGVSIANLDQEQLARKPSVALALVTPSASIVKNFRITNESSSAWPKGTSVAFKRGDRMEGAEQFMFDEAIQVGQSMNVAIKLQSPCKFGCYVAVYRLRDIDGHYFGVPIKVKVRVMDANKIVTIRERLQQRFQQPMLVDVPKSTEQSQPQVEQKSQQQQQPESKPRLLGRGCFSALPATVTAKYQSSLEQLHSLGFDSANDRWHLRLLHKFEGDVAKCVERMLQKQEKFQKKFGLKFQIGSDV
jgi:hypothetical protein